MREIKDPKFLKNLDNKQLEILAKEIREFLIDKISKTGGHLSSNLGIVDLTIAIHKNFDSPKDKIIFDVGHQAYTHKILTGRSNMFDKLRQKDGLSGFQKRNESEHDCYEAGHSSTSLSAALGFALARDMKKENNHVIAVIGDGSIGNGLAYEALNHIGSLDTKLIVILNDNLMSINKNVGALHNTLDKIRSNKKYQNTKVSTKGALHKIPYLGKPINNSITNIKESLKKFYMKEGYLFEEFGFEYYGPINGHDYEELNLYLDLAKTREKPVLLHVITEKGKGYKYAEEDQDGVWHGISPFDKETGKVITKNDDKVTFSEVISNHLVNIARDDKDIICITPAMANGSKLNKFKKEFKTRFIDVGIAEEHALVLANSMSLEGLKPFVSIYSTFLQRGYDQLSHDIARMNGNVVIGIDRAGIVGEDGETHQGIYDIAFINHIPNMTIMAPSNSIMAGDMLYTAFKLNGPCAIRYSKNKLVYKEKAYKMLDYGKWKMEKFGDDGYIITYGDYIDNALKIRDNLIKDNIKLTVVNAMFIKPFDTSMFTKILNENKPIFIYEEASSIGSLGDILCSYATKINSKCKIKCFNIKDEFIKQGKYDIIIKELGLDIESMTNNIKEYLGGK